jgi:uncharacterized protein (DUF2126 family)/transglutaminase-like putative cysteine protease
MLHTFNIREPIASNDFGYICAMAIRVALHHVTRYVYDRPVQLSPHVVRLRPAPHCRTAIAAYSLKVTPADHFENWQQDPFGNHLARYVFEKPTRELRVEVDLVADLVTINPFDFFLEEYAEKFPSGPFTPFNYEKALARELQPYLERTQTGARFSALLSRVKEELARPGRRTVDVLVDLNMLVQRSLTYDIRMEPGVFAPDETLERGHGSCRDFAWLLVNLLRGLGLAARFVSGYSIQLRPDQKPLEGPAGVSSDCTDLHAWAETFLPGAGWVGLDATSGLFCGEGHLPLACTAEPSNAAAITGSFAWDAADEDDELDEKFEVEMKVTRLEDRPRPTRSYSEEQWDAILACGDRVERALTEGDVRLTMGGEPTFVSIDDMEGAEWSVAALGPNKARLADELTRRLRARFAPGALLHHGQGKWYPGEQLPRWAYSCYWRKDGVPLWRDPQLLSDGRPQGHGPDEARAFLRALAGRLGVGEGHALPGYEDVWYYLWRERKLPVNVDPFESKLDDERERVRLRRVFQQGLSRVVGWALPVRPRDQDADGHFHWESGAWFLRDGRLYLIPGDSPMGFRLPLESLPWSAPDDLDSDEPRDPFAPRPPLQASRTVEQRRHAPSPEPTRGTSARNVVRTALCVEPREGLLHVFLPPVPQLEHFIDLIAKIEASAAELRMPVRLEGYLPPHDPRLQRFQVTPDPGVIEVNIHPATSWRELVDNTHAIYEEARATRLGTDKFMLDGRHTGTGGGNHVVLGGPTAADSPLLRRPDLLRSLTAYFLNHPSLSYLFSSLFVGPTSQAPRIDEARQDSLYELETAFAQLPRRGEPAPPWLADRLFRHLLTDVTGNVHRTELCIDKLFSPDSASGRQGLLELRAFEMPPDARMSAAQALLVRAMVAWFWREPYTRPLERWGTTLHDRFLLPHFVWQDICDVTRELQGAGIPLDAEWFRPHWEFRFPRHGAIAADGIALELRQAIEPWHVLGEEPGPGGTARYVDSSVERLEVRVSGLPGSRHVVQCNGRRVPLHPTGRAGEHVAGVRYKAWKPPSSLHPTLDVDTPLVFDVIDTWAGRAIGGCTYHVAHPGGLSYAVYPKNGLEAESRRATRFQPFGHSPGALQIDPETRSLELPMTLDLRRV